MTNTENSTPASPESRTTAPDSARERRIVLLLGLIALVCANLPYLLGVLWAPHGSTFAGLTTNIDDGGVYLSWIREAADGHFFLHNRFTTEPQQGLVFNLFFLLLGLVSRVGHLGVTVVYAGARIVFGATLLWSIWRLIAVTIPERRARLFAFAFVCFASGFGFGHDFDPTLAFEQPIDRWQPEAITFLSLYYSPLFTAALTLMVEFVRSFVITERSGRLRDLWPALVAGLLLGNFHSYDILQLFALVCVYRVATDIAARKFELAGYVRIACIGIAMLPTTGYQFWALQHEAVFHARAFDTSTLSVSLRWVLIGFGLPLMLAILSPVIPAVRSRIPGDILRLLLVWSVVAVAISYTPHVSFQRKLIMGAHLPLCLLAGCTLATVTEGLSGSLPVMASVFAILVTVPSNLRFVLGDLVRLQQNSGATQYRPYLSADESESLSYLNAHLTAGTAVLAPPDMTAQLHGAPGAMLMPNLGVFIPALTSGSVYCAHWSETENYGRKLNDIVRFYKAATTDDERQTFLNANPTIQYVVYTNNLAQGLRDQNGESLMEKATGEPLYTGVDWTPSGTHPSFLQPVWQNSTIIIYRVEK